MVGLMIIGTIDTANYEFVTLADSPTEALEQLRNAWETHSATATGRLYSFEELDVRLRPLNVGDVLSNCVACENLAHELPACENCGTTGPGANAWAGWCHDCDNGACPECGALQVGDCEHDN